MAQWYHITMKTEGSVVSIVFAENPDEAVSLAYDDYEFGSGSLVEDSRDTITSISRIDVETDEDDE